MRIALFVTCPRGGAVALFPERAAGTPGRGGASRLRGVAAGLAALTGHASGDAAPGGPGRPAGVPAQGPGTGPRTLDVILIVTDTSGANR